jgi:serine protease SohB
VQDYGLAAALVERLSREAGLTVTACVDKIAASGGYMIASQAHSLLAAPFATVGSVGVIREGLNIHDALQRYGIKGLVLKAGDSKVPLTMLGKVTSSDVAKAQRTLDTMHKAFQQLVARGRPQLGEDIDDVCNGDIYFGENAKSLSLVDRIVTSEEYLLERIQAGDRVMKLHRAHQYVIGKRKLFHPLDFLRERSAPLRVACAKWIRSDLESMLSRVVAATSVMGAVQVLAQYGRDSGMR